MVKTDRSPRFGHSITKADLVAFDTSVFVNCPFDKDYKPLLRPLLFTILDLGFEPRIALERLNSAEPRIDKILELIEASKYGIHDLSRLRAEQAGEFYRMNMPFELALDVACRLYKGGECADKKCLILEAWILTTRQLSQIWLDLIFRRTVGNLNALWRPSAPGSMTKVTWGLMVPPRFGRDSTTSWPTILKH